VRVRERAVRVRPSGAPVGRFFASRAGVIATVALAQERPTVVPGAYELDILKMAD